MASFRCHPSESSAGGLVKTFVWGLDAADGGGSATGNIGGLLAVDDWTDGRQYQVGYDGMGNVSLLVDAVDGGIAAAIEYGSFGEILRATGDWRATPFLFSTKWHLDYGPLAGTHWPLELYDYGYRVHSPGLGRFVNRDRIGEAGGENLYAFVGNDPVNRWDYLGLAGLSSSRTFCVEVETRLLMRSLIKGGLCLQEGRNRDSERRDFVGL